MPSYLSRITNAAVSRLPRVLERFVRYRLKCSCKKSRSRSAGRRRRQS